MPDFLENRYARQILLPEIGDDGQNKLRRAAVLVVGTGGLGCPLSLLLTCAGVGRIGLMDDDKVSLTNLHRQILFTESEIGQNKAEAASHTLARHNSEVILEPITERLTKENAASLIARYDLVLDGTDNFQTRLILDTFCKKLKKPFVYGAVYGWEGQVAVFHYPPTSDIGYTRLYDPAVLSSLPPPEKAIVAMSPTVVAGVMAAQAISILCDGTVTLAGRLWTIDLRTMESHTITL